MLRTDLMLARVVIWWREGNRVWVERSRLCGSMDRGMAWGRQIALRLVVAGVANRAWAFCEPFPGVSDERVCYRVRELLGEWDHKQQSRGRTSLGGGLLRASGGVDDGNGVGAPLAVA